jgi:hypothetical protein
VVRVLPGTKAKPGGFVVVRFTKEGLPSHGAFTGKFSRPYKAMLKQSEVAKVVAARFKPTTVESHMKKAFTELELNQDSAGFCAHRAICARLSLSS